MLPPPPDRGNTYVIPQEQFTQTSPPCSSFLTTRISHTISVRSDPELSSESDKTTTNRQKNPSEFLFLHFPDGGQKPNPNTPPVTEPNKE